MPVCHIGEYHHKKALVNIITQHCLVLITVVCSGITMTMHVIPMPYANRELYFTHVKKDFWG